MCILKKNWTMQVCIDFRRLNQDIINNTYTMRRIKDQMESIRGSTVFTTLNLTKRYHQLQLNEKSQEVTAFTTPNRLFQ